MRPAAAFLLVLCTALTLALGTAKLFVQRAHPPAHVGADHHRYEGFVSIDQYCLRAERFRDWLHASPGVPPDERAAARARLREDLESGLLPTAVLVPALVGGIGRWSGSIPLTLAVLSGAAVVAEALLLVALGARLARGAGGRAAGLTAGVLFAAHVDTARAAMQLLLDPFAAAFAVAGLLAALRRRDGRRGASAALFAVQAAGPFVKLTYAPLLAAPALVELCVPGPGRLGRAARAGLGFGLLPALPVLLYLAWVPGAAAFGEEMGRAVRSSGLSGRELARFAVEMALLLQLTPFLWLAGRRAPGVERGALDGVALSALLVVACVAGLRLPDDYRLYLPALGLLAAAAAPGLVRLAGRRLVPALGLYALANVLVAAYGLWTHLPRTG